MKTELLDIGHRELLSSRLRAVDTPVSEYSFPNLYLFRRVHRYDVIFGEEILIRGTTYDGHRYLMPTRDVRETGIDYLESLMGEVDFLFPIPEAWLPAFDHRRFSCTTHGGESDYVYTVEKLSTLKGRRLHGKRNLVRQFMDQYRHNGRPLTTDLLDDARLVLEKWQEEGSHSRETRDYYPCREALDRYDEIGLCGGIYYADGEPAGFVIGEEVNNETFVLHFAKARTVFKGIYQFMFNSFAKVLPPKYRFINFEQDLDKPALRLAKASFLPDRMITKTRIALKQGSGAGRPAAKGG